MRLVVTNDVHSAALLRPDLLARIDALRSDGYLVLDSGDFFEGTVVFEELGARGDIDVLRVLYDVTSPGNHGFEFYEMLATDPVAPCVTVANLVGWPGPKFCVDTRHKVVVIGLIGQQAFSSIDADTSRYDWEPPLRPARKYWELSQQLGFDFVILSHQGFEEDCTFAQELSREGIKPSAIFSGHCHSDRYTEMVHDIPIVKARENGNGFITLDDGGVQSSVLKLSRGEHSLNEVAPLAKYESLISTIEESSTESEILNVTIEVASSRSALQALLLDTLLKLTAAPAGILNNGSVRTELSHTYPTFSLARLIEMIPFDNSIEIVNLDTSADVVHRHLREHYGEPCLVQGAPTSNQVVTTRFLAERIAMSGFTTQRAITHLTLRQVARIALIAKIEYSKSRKDDTDRT